MTESDSSPHRGANVVDVHVGGRIRLRRKLLGMTQQQLAEALGVSFQQVQKYERGSNRVSASTLYEAAEVLTAPLAYFFEGLEGSTGDIAGDSIGAAERSFLATQDGVRLAKDFMRIDQPDLRHQLIGLIRALADARGERDSAA